MGAAGRAGAGVGVLLTIAALVEVADGDATVVASGVDKVCAIAVADGVAERRRAVCVGRGVVEGSGVAAT